MFMSTLLLAVLAGLAFIVAYHTYGRWLGKRVFNLTAGVVCPSHRLRDDYDYVPTKTPIVFGHHFTSIAGTGPIVGPAIAVIWGWLPALLWVVFGSIFIGAVHDFGALVVSLRNNGQTVGDIAGRLLNRRVRLLFLIVLFLALTIVLAIFGLVIAAVFKRYPESIFPCVVQVPIAVAIGLYLHRRGVNLLIPSILALAVMYLTVIFGDVGLLHTINTTMASWSTITWVIILLIYSATASVLPVWALLQPRDYINSLQLLTALGLVVVGLVAASFIGGAPPVEGAERVPLEIVAPAWNPDPAGAPLVFPFLFITIACGAISGFHCLVSSGTSSKQLDNEPDARFVGYGAMLTEGFLATIVILACVAGLGLGVTVTPKAASLSGPEKQPRVVSVDYTRSDGQAHRLDAIGTAVRWGPLGSRGSSRPIHGYEADLTRDAHYVESEGVWLAQAQPASEGAPPLPNEAALVASTAWKSRYSSWSAAGSLGAKVSAFVDGSANFLKTIGMPAGIAVALMGVLVASFAGTTLDTACRLQRYVVQELAATFIPLRKPQECAGCGYDLTLNTSGRCPECGAAVEPAADPPGVSPALAPFTRSYDMFLIFRNKYAATLFAVGVAVLMAGMPAPGAEWSWANAGKGGLILWPMFGATNQLLGGLAFLVIGFYLWRRGKPVWFLGLPMLFMLVMPAWAMLVQLPHWLNEDNPNTALILIAVATLALEVWMVTEAVLLWPRVKGELEPVLAEAPPDPVPAAGVDG